MIERKNEVQELGHHVLVEFYGCDPDILDNLDSVRKNLVEAARLTGATVVGEVFHKFAPQGVSGTVVIAESHLAIHTWPELGYCALDLYTCGDRVDPWKGFHHLLQVLKAKRYYARALKRGIHEEEELDYEPEFVIRSLSTNERINSYQELAV